MSQAESLSLCSPNDSVCGKLPERASPTRSVFVEGIGAMLEKMARTAAVQAMPSVFAGWSCRGSPVPFAKYASRLVKCCAAQEEDLVHAVILMDRASYNDFVCTLTQATFHRLFLAALVVSLKYRQDFHHTQRFFAAAGGVTVTELNMFERALLLSLDFDVYVDPDSYATFCTALAAHDGLADCMQPHILVRRNAPRSCFEQPCFADTPCGRGYRCCQPRTLLESLQLLNVGCGVRTGDRQTGL